MKISLPKSLADITSDFEPIDPATYKLAVTNCDQKIGNTSGNPYLNIEFTVLDDDDFEGRKVFDIISLGESSLWKLKQFADSAGINIDDEFDTEDFVGEEITADVGIKKSDEFGDKNCVIKYT